MSVIWTSIPQTPFFLLSKQFLFIEPKKDFFYTNDPFVLELAASIVIQNSEFSIWNKNIIK